MSDQDELELARVAVYMVYERVCDLAFPEFPREPKATSPIKVCNMLESATANFKESIALQAIQYVMRDFCDPANGFDDIAEELTRRYGTVEEKA